MIISTPFDAAAVRSGEIKLPPRVHHHRTTRPEHGFNRHGSGIWQEYLGEEAGPAETAGSADSADPAGSAPSKYQVRSIGDLRPPPILDPNVLIEKNFLNLGGGMVLAGPTGVGKSSFAMDLAMSFGAGLERFGFKPARPLKSLIVQAENDDRDLYEMQAGVGRGLGFTPEQLAEVFARVKFVTIDDLCGEAFLRELALLLELARPDILWIDNLLSYLGGDVSSQEVVSKFLRNGLNPLLHRFGCACILIHHTNKPASGKEKPDWQAGDLAYLGSGSAEIANWARAVIAIRSIGSHDVFELVAGKGGSRLGWRAADGSKVYTKTIAHANDGGIYWREVGDDERPPEPQTKGLPTKEDLLPHVPLDMPISKNALRAKVNAAGVALNRINGLIAELVHDGTMHVWLKKRPRTGPEVLLARFPQPPEEPTT